MRCRPMQASLNTLCELDLTCRHRVSFLLAPSDYAARVLCVFRRRRWTFSVQAAEVAEWRRLLILAVGLTVPVMILHMVDHAE